MFVLNRAEKLNALANDMREQFVAAVKTPWELEAAPGFEPAFRGQLENLEVLPEGPPARLDYPRLARGVRANCEGARGPLSARWGECAVASPHLKSRIVFGAKRSGSLTCHRTPA